MKADYLNRIVDYDDWLFNPLVFAWLDMICGPHSIGRFADHNNHPLT